MNTAKTLQLLDANNTNISPAVCIESLYYEKDGKRKALGDSIIIAGESVKNNKPAYDQSLALKDIVMPYNYLTKKNNSNIYELNCQTYNIGQQIYTSIENLASAGYAKIEDVSTSFLDLDGINHMNNSITIVNDSFTGTIGSKSIKWSEGTSGTTGRTAEIKAEIVGTGTGRLTLIENSSDYLNNSQQIQFGTENSSLIKLQTKNTIIEETSDAIGLSSKYVYINSSSNSSIYSNASIGLYAKQDIIQNASANIYLNYSQGLYVNGLKFNKAPLDGTTAYMLVSGKVNNEYTWNEVPTITITNGTDNMVYGGKNVAPITVYSRSIVGGISGTLYKTTTPSQEQNILIRGIVCGNTQTDIVASASTPPPPPITFRTIRGENLLGGNDISTLVKFDDLKTLTTADIKNPDADFRIIGISEQNENSFNGSTTTTGSLVHKKLLLSRLTNAYIKTTGAIYASSLYSISDKRLKDDIKEADVSVAPEIKEFTWKESGEHTYGFIAQELEELGYSDVVKTDNQGYKRVDYNAALCIAVQVLQKENKELKDRISKLEDIIKK